MVVSVDFDGTITRAAEPVMEGFNKLAPHCKAVMEELAGMGVEFRLLTARRDCYVPEAVNLCKEWGLPIDLSTPTRKTGADVFIDDRNLGCTGIDWKDIRKQLLKMLKVEKSGFYTEETR